MFKVDNRDTRKMCEILSKLTIKTQKWRLFLVFLLLTLKQLNLVGLPNWLGFYHLKWGEGINSFMTEAVIIQKPVHWFAEQINGLISYRNQSTDLQSKSMDWFLCDNGLRHERVNTPHEGYNSAKIPKLKKNWRHWHLLKYFDLVRPKKEPKHNY